MREGRSMSFCRFRKIEFKSEMDMINDCCLHCDFQFERGMAFALRCGKR